MMITMTAKVDGDVKDLICQYISRYCAVLKQMSSVLSPIAADIKTKEVHNVGTSFCSKIKDKCDVLNDVLGLVSQSLDDPRLPKGDLQKKIIFPWYDSCKSWIHDSRGFIQKVYPIIRDYKGGHIHDKDFHSIYELHIALLAMALSVRTEILNKHVNYEKNSCEIYKMFDRIRKCYRPEEDGFSWNVNGEFYQKVKCVRGFEVVPLNLYANALKYLPNGVCSDRKRCISLSFDEDENGLSISVSSVGPIVPENEIEKLCDVGYRATTANLGSTDGAGRGLSTVKMFCEAAGYRIKISSEHRIDDGVGWGLFTVSISIPKSCFVLTDARDCDTSYRIKYA